MVSEAQTIPRAVEVGKRIQLGMEFAGLSLEQLMEARGWSERKINMFLCGNAVPDHTDTMRLAATLSVDPRWLLIGTPSEAAEEAQAQLRRGLESLLSISEADGARLLLSMGATLQPMTRLGTCRYCHTRHDTEDYEKWADDDSTICVKCMRHD